MRENNFLPEIRFDDNKPLKVNICKLKFSSKDKIIIKEISKKTKLK